MVSRPQHIHYIPQRRPSVLYAVCLTRLGNIQITGRLTLGGGMWSRGKLGCSLIDRHATHSVFNIGRHPNGMLGERQEGLGPMPVSERFSRLLNGHLIVDCPLVTWSTVLSRGTRGDTYPELIGLSFQHHPRTFRGPQIILSLRESVTNEKQGG